MPGLKFHSTDAYAGFAVEAVNPVPPAVGEVPLLALPDWSFQLATPAPLVVVLVPASAFSQNGVVYGVIATRPLAPAPPSLVPLVLLAPPPPPPGVLPSVPFALVVEPFPPLPPPVGAVPPVEPLPAFPFAAVPAEEPPPPALLFTPVAPFPPLYVTCPKPDEAAPPAAPLEVLSSTLPPPFAIRVEGELNQVSPPAAIVLLPNPKEYGII